MWLRTTLILCTIAFALADDKRWNIQSSINKDDLTASLPAIFPTGVNIAENNTVLQKEVDNTRYKRSNHHNKINVVKSILNRLNEGERQVKYAEDANIVLVLGNIGAGKSTFVQFMAGNNLSSVAVRNRKGRLSGDYIIIDEHAKISKFPVIPHTEVPDLVIDVKTNTSIYDCPGFSDTRNPEHDIAGTYFIKKVTDAAKKIKFVFMVNYSLFQGGYDRTDFMILLNHATNMIKNITKYQDSIAIVVTKVDNNKSDDQVIFDITDLLYEVKEELMNEPDLNNNMIQFIDALLTTNEPGDEIYTRIGIFRRPNEAGLLSTMKTFQDNKKSLENLIHNNTKFIEIDNSNDFGYTISADSQIYVLDLVKEIKNNISSSVADIANLVREHYRISIQKMLNKINLFSSSMDIIDANVIEAQSFSTHINSGYDKILNLIKEIKNVKSAEELSSTINSSLNFLNLNIIRNKVSVISDQGRYLKFLAEVSVNEFNSSDLSISSDPFQSIVKYLNESKNLIYKNIIDVEYQVKNKIQNIINNIGQKIKNYVPKKKEKFYTIENLNHDIESAFHKLSEIQKTENDITEIDKRISKVLDNIYELNIPDKDIISANNFYDTLEFIHEFYALEHQFFALHKKISFLPFYESLFNRVNQYKEKMRNDTNNEEYQTLKYIHTIIFSKIHGMKNDPDKNLVINFASYFESVKERITLYKNTLQQVKIYEYHENYQIIIQKEKILEADDLINIDILPEIYGILKETDENIMLLANETISLINIAASEKKEIEEAKKKLEGLMIAKTMLSGIEIAGAVLSLAGSVGVAIGMGTALVAEVAQSGIRKKSQKTNQVTSLPDSVSRPIEMVTNLLKIEKKNFQEQLHDVMKEFNEFSNDSDSMSDIKNEIENAQEQVNEITPNNMARNSSSVDLMKTLRKKLKKSLEKKQKKLESEKSDNDKNNKFDNNENIKRKLKVIKKSKKHLSKACKALRFNEDSTDHIEDIEKVNEKIDKLEKYEENIYNIIIPMIQFIEKLFTETRENSNGNSHMALDVSKWKMQSILKDVQIQIREMTQGFNVQVSLIRCIEKFEYGVVTVIQMYDRIQDAYEKKQLINYIADINSGVKSTSNENYRNAINKLDLILISNLVLNEYVHAMNAFEQDIFPYANMYLSQFEIDYDNINWNDIVEEAVKKITELSDTVVKHSSTPNPTIDKYFHRKTVFHSDSSGPGEFFVWKHEEYHGEISKLLNGKAITIKADIVKGIKHNAVKFNEIGLQFKLSNTTLQQELNTQLKPFIIKMTHLGDSYYKCGNQFYIINHDQQMISHHVILESGTYANENNVYSKIKENPPILSPYSMWKIQLQHSNNTAFEKLIKFADESIDLGLVGKGQYVDTEDSVCNDSLEKYYKVADIQSTIN